MTRLPLLIVLGTSSAIAFPLCRPPPQVVFQTNALPCGPRPPALRIAAREERRGRAMIAPRSSNQEGIVGDDGFEWSGLAGASPAAALSVLSMEWVSTSDDDVEVRGVSR